MSQVVALHKDQGVTSGVGPEGDRSETEQPFPILSSEQYRFLRYAVELLEAVRGGCAEGQAIVSSQPEDAVELRLSRLRLALCLFEEFPPPADGAEDAA